MNHRKLQHSLFTDEPMLPKFIALPSGCWIWTRATSSDGYGRVWIDNKAFQAHRLIWETLNGPIPFGLTLDHLCRTPFCVNPGHMEPVSVRENVLRGLDNPMAVNARKTRCIRGHEFAGENLRIDRRGRRACKMCSREKLRLWRANNRGAF